MKPKKNQSRTTKHNVRNEAEYFPSARPQYGPKHQFVSEIKNYGFESAVMSPTHEAVKDFIMKSDKQIDIYNTSH